MNIEPNRSAFHYDLIAEAIRQVRGECGDRQIPDCEVIQYICATNITLSAIFRK